MAVKNRKMDSILADSAMREFLTYGFNDASLRRIADAAGTTTGSIYMRYANKDRLFCSLTDCIVEETEKAFEELKPLYAACRTPDDLVKAAEAESDRILRILFEHYDAATLLLCKSEGSSASAFFAELVQRKVQESEAFFSGFPNSEDLKHTLDILVTVQFDMYRQILKNGYREPEARRCMEMLMKFMNAGWTSLADELMEERRN